MCLASRIRDGKSVSGRGERKKKVRYLNIEAQTGDGDMGVQECDPIKETFLGNTRIAHASAGCLHMRGKIQQVVN